MRIKWNGSIHKVDTVQIGDSGDNFKVDYWQLGVKSSFFLPKSSTVFIPDSYVRVANKSLLERGFFNFDTDFKNTGNCF